MVNAKSRDPARLLARELTALRSQVDEVVNHYSLNVKARIDELVHVLQGKGGSEETAARVTPETLEKLAAKAQRMKVKPQKGRAKDLRRIQDLVDAMTETLIDQE
jgi:hypothetical protein